MMADVLDFNEPKTEKPITAALQYAARGWPVFPCNPLTKAPLIGRLTRLSQMIGKSTSDTLKAVAPMVDRGLVIQTGSEGAWRWELSTEGEEI